MHNFCSLTALFVLAALATTTFVLADNDNHKAGNALTNDKDINYGNGLDYSEAGPGDYNRLLVDHLEYYQKEEDEEDEEEEATDDEEFKAKYIEDEEYDPKSVIDNDIGPDEVFDTFTSLLADANVTNLEGPHGRRRGLRVRIEDSCRWGRHGGGYERYDVIQAVNWLKAHSSLLRSLHYKRYAATRVRASSVKRNIRIYLSGSNYKKLKINCQHTRKCRKDHDVDGSYLGASRIRLCYENMVRKRFSLCDLVGIIAHEMAHAAYMPTTGGDNPHSRGNDRVYRFGHTVRDWCEAELTYCENYRLDGVRVIIHEPVDGEQAIPHKFVKQSDGTFRADIRVLASSYDGADGEDSTANPIRWTFRHRPNSPNGWDFWHQKQGSVYNNYMVVKGTCGCTNWASARVDVEASDEGTGCAEHKFKWSIGCDPDGAPPTCMDSWCRDENGARGCPTYQNR